MKKFVLLVAAVAAMALQMCFVSCGDSEGANTIRAGIIAEDMVRADVLSADDLDFDLVGVDEETTDEYHAVANIKTLNGLGMKVPRKVSIRLKYNGGDWREATNWTCLSLSYLDEATGKTQTSTTAVDESLDVFNEAKDGQHETIAGIDFTLLYDNQYTTNLSSKRKLTKNEVVKVCKTKHNKDLYFYVDGRNESLADCYAHCIGGNIEYDGVVIK